MPDDAELSVFEDSHFRIAHCADVDVAGYLVVSIRENREGWADLGTAERGRLGDVLALAAEAVMAVARPERVYVCSFGEDRRSLHFHVFPRYAWMAGLFRERIGAPDIDGPAVLALIRRERRRPAGGAASPEAVRQIVRSLRQWIEERTMGREKEGGTR